MKEKKYKLTNKTIKVNNHILHRIQALKEFENFSITIHKGKLGGYVESETNLSQKGNCWVFDNAKVYGDAIVYGNAKVKDNAEIYGNVMVWENAKIFDNANIFGHAKIYGNSQIFGNAWICNSTKVFGNAQVFGDSVIKGQVKIFGDTRIFGSTDITGNAIIQSEKDYMTFKNNWSSCRYFTWTKSNNMWCDGCFYGTGEELIKKAYEKSEISGKKYEATVKYAEILNKIKIITYERKKIHINR